MYKFVSAMTARMLHRIARRKTIVCPTSNEAGFGAPARGQQRLGQLAADGNKGRVEDEALAGRGRKAVYWERPRRRGIYCSCHC